MNKTADQQLEHMIATRRPGLSLEQAFYTDEEIFRTDMDRVFRWNWLCVGHVGRIPRPGDYFTFEIAEDSIIVIHGDEDEVHALFNTCRHRGSRVCLDRCGHAAKLVCPYHQWVYETNGALRNARQMPEDFDRSAFSLFRAPCQVAEGLIFVYLGDKASDFSPFLRDVVPRMKPHNLGIARLAYTKTYYVAANWKLIMENSRECYHCGSGHPQYCKAHGAAGADYADLGEMALWEASSQTERFETLRRQGIDPSPILFQPDTWYQCRRTFFRKGFATESMDGKPIAPLMSPGVGWDAGVLFVLARPNLMVNINVDHGNVTTFLPLSARMTRVDIDWVVHPDAIEGRDYDLDHLIDFSRLTSEQDWKLCEDNQAGVNSSQYRPGPYAPTEVGAAVFVDWYLRELERHRPM
jgi:Rieske 2Fe-2S family protein